MRAARYKVSHSACLVRALALDTREPAPNLHPQIHTRASVSPLLSSHLRSPETSAFSACADLKVSFIIISALLAQEINLAIKSLITSQRRVRAPYRHLNPGFLRG